MVVGRLLSYLRRQLFRGDVKLQRGIHVYIRYYDIDTLRLMSGPRIQCIHHLRLIVWFSHSNIRISRFNIYISIFTISEKYIFVAFGENKKFTNVEKKKQSFRHWGVNRGSCNYYDDFRRANTYPTPRKIRSSSRNCWLVWRLGWGGSCCVGFRMVAASIYLGK